MPDIAPASAAAPLAASCPRLHPLAASAAAGAVPALRHGRADGPPGLVLGVECPPVALVQPFRGRRAEASGRLRSLGGPAAPDTPSGAQGEAFSLVWAGPEGWLALGGDPAAIADALDGIAAVADQSDARFVVTLGGPAARETLAKGVDLDLHPRAFTPGAATLTRVRQIGVALWLRDPTFVLIAPRPTAQDLHRWLLRAGAATGVERRP